MKNCDLIVDITLNESDGHVGGLIGQSMGRENMVLNVSISGYLGINTTTSSSDRYAIGGIVGFA